MIGGHRGLGPSALDTVGVVDVGDSIVRIRSNRPSFFLDHLPVRVDGDPTQPARRTIDVVAAERPWPHWSLWIDEVRRSGTEGDGTVAARVIAELQAAAAELAGLGVDGDCLADGSAGYAIVGSRFGGRPSLSSALVATGWTTVSSGVIALTGERRALRLGATGTAGEAPAGPSSVDIVGVAIHAIGAPNETTVERLSQGAAMIELCRAATDAGRPLTEQGFDRLARLASAVPTWQVTMESMDAEHAATLLRVRSGGREP